MLQLGISTLAFGHWHTASVAHLIQEEIAGSMTAVVGIADRCLALLRTCAATSQQLTSDFERDAPVRTLCFPFRRWFGLCGLQLGLQQ